MRTIAIGDIHGDYIALDSLLSKLPRLTTADTLVFLGDYCDRGPDSRGVIARIRHLEDNATHRVVALRGNHEDSWARALSAPNPGFLLHRGNGCLATWRSFCGHPPTDGDDELSEAELLAMLDVRSWLPADIATWMVMRPIWYEDPFAIYVHAGLDTDDDVWLHPSQGRDKPVLWGRDAAFFRHYEGKRVVFGHTRTRDLPRVDGAPCPADNDTDDPTLHSPSAERLRPKVRSEVWCRGDLIGLDTGAGMGGYLSAISLPDLTVYESR